MTAESSPDIRDLPLEGPSPGAAVARDMVRRGLFVLPVVVGVAAVVADWPTAASIGYAMILVLGNLLLSAYLLAGAARISLGLLPSVALGGYAVRLALVFAAVWLIADHAWVRIVPLGITIIATHLGMLVWELRHVAATFTHAGLKPVNGDGSRRRSQPAAGYRPDRKGSRLPSQK